MGYLEAIDQLGSGKTAGISPHARWHAAYREIARITYGIMPEDPRLESVLAAIDECDKAFYRGDWGTFCEASTRVKLAVRGVR